jgi:hypothetical protein
VKLTAAGGGAPGDNFGWQVAISGDTAVVGCLGCLPSGAAYVFVRGADGWSQQAELTLAQPQPNGFGRSVAVDANSTGTTAVVGGPDGTAVVFFRPAGSEVWSQQAVLHDPAGNPLDEFGAAVAVIGSNALVGAWGADGDTGAAYVFHRVGHHWGETAELTASDRAVGDVFGDQVSFSGSYALIGAEGHDLATGAAYVFVHGSNGWSQQAELVGSDSQPGDVFSNGVAISGSTAVVGAPGHDVVAGAAYVFVRSGSTWSQQAELTASDADSAVFGQSTGLSGSTAVIGAPNRDSGTGAAYVFHRSSTTGLWTQTRVLTASDGMPGDILGFSAATNGSIAIVGAPTETGSVGAAYVFADN